MSLKWSEILLSYCTTKFQITKVCGTFISSVIWRLTVIMHGTHGLDERHSIFWNAPIVNSGVAFYIKNTI